MIDLKRNDIVRVANLSLAHELSKNWNRNKWRIVLFPEDGDNVALIENLYTQQQTFIPLSELEFVSR